jgi:hypothetical protein
VYSIYDQYGTIGDLQSRYDASKSAGNPSANIYQNRFGNIPDNAPFLKANGGIPLLKNNGPSSIYDYSPVEGQANSPSRDDIYGNNVNWSNYPSPAIFGYMANYMPAAIGTLASIPAGGFGGGLIGYGVGEAIKSATDKNRTWTDRGIDAAKYVGGNIIGRFSPAGNLTKGIDNPFARMGANFAINQGLKWGLNSVMDMLTGNITSDKDPYQGPRNMFERGVDWVTGKYDPGRPTIGSPTNDPFLAVGPDTEVDNRDNMLGDQMYDPYGATPDSGWGTGGSMSDSLGNDISGYDWSWGDI